VFTYLLRAVLSGLLYAGSCKDPGKRKRAHVEGKGWLGSTGELEWVPGKGGVWKDWEEALEDEAVLFVEAAAGAGAGWGSRVRGGPFPSETLYGWEREEVARLVAEWKRGGEAGLRELLGRIRAMGRAQGRKAGWTSTWKHLTHTCYSCGGQGHQRGDPSCPKSRARPGRGLACTVVEVPWPGQWPPPMPPPPPAPEEAPERKKKSLRLSGAKCRKGLGAAAKAAWKGAWADTRSRKGRAAERSKKEKEKQRKDAVKRRLLQKEIKKIQEQERRARKNEKERDRRALKVARRK